MSYDRVPTGPCRSDTRDDLVRRPVPGALSASLTFAWRSLLKIKHVPEQLGDVIGIPILFTLHVHLSVRRRTGRIDQRTTCSSSCQARSLWPLSSSPSTPGSP